MSKKLNHFKIIIPLLLILFFSSLKIYAQQKYMLCVGINNYTNRASDTITSWDGRFIHNLTGCINDADTISKIFIKYYGFDEHHIEKLFDRNAKRDSIINALQNMASVCNAGDYMVFYYSGHGSIIYNESTQRNFAKGYQNSLVPADAAIAGVRDISNNTLNDLMLAFTKKHVHLTVIMDACNSGTNTRGTTLYELTGTKEVEASHRVFTKTAEEMKATIPLATQGAATFAACQDNQEAKELRIGTRTFSAFTMSLCEAITEWYKAPAKDIYSLAVAKIKFLNGDQVPVMEGAAERLNENLPGTTQGENKAASFPLIATDGAYQIQGGFLDGLSEGDILVSNGNKKDSVQVTVINGPERSTVKTINKNGQLKDNSSNARYSLLRMAMQPEAPLKIFIGKGLPDADVKNIIKEAAVLKLNKTVHWITPADGVLPQATIYYNSSEHVWKMNKDGIINPVVLKDLRDPSLISSLTNFRVYLQLPYAAALADSLTKIILQKSNRNIHLLPSSDEANYLLTGNFDKNNLPEYGWISMKWKSPALADIPLRTDFFNDNDVSKISTGLYDRLEKLGKIASWLTLQSPLPDGTIQFPFTIKIRDTKNKLLADKIISGKVFTGDTLKINFEQDNYSTIKWNNERLFIYVFSIDPKGNIQLVFPGERTSIFDYPRSNNDPWLATIRNTTAGTYHYFLLSCKERIINTDVFNQQGVITRDGEVFDNPLEALINDGGVNGRGNIRTPSNWSLQRVDVLTIDKAAVKK